MGSVVMVIYALQDRVYYNWSIKKTYTPDKLASMWTYNDIVDGEYWFTCIVPGVFNTKFIY